MERQASTKDNDDGTRAARDNAGKNAWVAPRLTTIDVEDAQSSLTFASDGLYAVS